MAGPKSVFVTVKIIVKDVRILFVVQVKYLVHPYRCLDVERYECKYR